jgi:3-methyladenine DNA glycosylase/8-oxoguanine DNA glycosylase
VRVAVPAPFDFALSMERFRTFGPDPVNLWDDGALFRAFDGTEVRLTAADGGVKADGAEEAARPAIQRFLGSPFDLPGFAAFAASADAVLAGLEERLRGYRPSLIPDAFEMLVGSITSQQVSLWAALAIRRRFVERFSAPVGRVYPFPARDAVAGASVDELRALGFSTRKGEYVLALARAELDLDALGALPDEEVRERLVALPGIGEWTVDWFLARHVGRADAWPAGDLGLRKAISGFYFAGSDVSLAEARGFGNRFAPWQNLAAQYLLVGLRVSP